MQGKGNYIKNRIITKASSLPLLFSRCHKDVGCQTSSSRRSTDFSGRKMFKSLESIIKKEPRKFHEEIFDEEYKLLVEEYGNNNDRAIYSKFADKNLNFALYGKSLTDFDIYTNIEENKDGACNDVVWYSVFNNNLVEIGRKTIEKSTLFAYYNESVVKVGRKTSKDCKLGYDVYRHSTEIKTGYLIDLYNNGSISISKNNELNDYKQVYRGPIFSIPHSSCVRFNYDNNSAKLGKDGKIITKDSRIINKLSKSDLEKMGNFWDAIYF